MRTLTEKKIINSFVSLLIQTDFYSLSVKSIVEHANINRSTFYDYYYDKYDLWEKIEKDISKNIQQQIKKDRDLWGDFWEEKSVHAMLNSNSIKLHSLEYIYENRNLLKILFSNNAPQTLWNDLNLILKNKLKISEKISQDNFIDGNYIETLFILSITQPVLMWINESNPETPENFFRSLLKMRLKVPC
ncbi:hypothetical protein IGK38_002989 [Enterococcus pernyi]